MTPLSGCDHGCWWEADALVRHRPRSAMLGVRRSVQFGRTRSLSCPRELSPVLPKLRHREAHAVWLPLWPLSLKYALPMMLACRVSNNVERISSSNFFGVKGKRQLRSQLVGQES